MVNIEQTEFIDIINTTLLKTPVMAATRKKLPKIDLNQFRLEEMEGQIPFDFARSEHADRMEGLNKPATEADFQAVRAAMLRQAPKIYQVLLDSNERVFQIKRYNDRKSVETDFGAPSHGLHFVKDLLDPVRASRYEPLEVIGQYKSHVNHTAAIGTSLRRQGFSLFKEEKPEIFPVFIHFSNGGITRCFTDIANTVVTKFEHAEKAKKEFGKDQKGAILLPVPTYGLFYWHLADLLEDKDIVIVPVQRHDNGSVDQSSLKRAIKECELKNIRILMYYDSNPNNPSGYIRERSETEDLSAILMEAGQKSFSKDLDAISEIMNANKISEHMVSDEIKVKTTAWFNNLNSPFSFIINVDDMAYQGLEHTGRKKPYSFGQVSTAVAQRSAVLMGVSKIGLPGLRMGMMVTHPSLTSPLAGKQLMEEFAAHSFGVDVLTARYGAGSAHKKKFAKHEEDLRRTHNYKTGIIEAMFHGLENTDRLTDRQKQKLVKDYAAYSYKSPAEAKRVLSEGLAPFHLEADIEAGFFHRVNCDALAGQRIYAKFDDMPYPIPVSLYNNDMLGDVFKAFEMKVVSAAQQGASENTFQVRITLSLPDKELFRFYDSMQEMRGYFFGENPEIQLDLFRKNYPAPKPL